MNGLGPPVGAGAHRSQDPGHLSPQGLVEAAGVEGVPVPAHSAGPPEATGDADIE